MNIKRLIEKRAASWAGAVYLTLVCVVDGSEEKFDPVSLSRVNGISGIEGILKEHYDKLKIIFLFSYEGFEFCMFELRKGTDYLLIANPRTFENVSFSVGGVRDVDLLKPYEISVFGRSVGKNGPIDDRTSSIDITIGSSFRVKKNSSFQLSLTVVEGKKNASWNIQRSDVGLWSASVNSLGSE